jgi:4'-phosphopantetheinyl transferase
MNRRPFAEEGVQASGGARHDAAGEWRAAPPLLLLAERSVHVWRGDTRCFVRESGGAEAIAELLAPEERTRAERLLDPLRRLRWMAARALARTLIGRYLDLHPRELRIVADEHGKPRLAQARTVSFNLSHSGELVLCALAHTAVGIDVQTARPSLDHVAVSARAFGLAQAQRLEGLDAELRSREFLRLWTRHEAALKCRGTGLGRAGAGSPGAPVRWVGELELGDHAAGALACSLAPASVRLWDATGMARADRRPLQSPPTNARWADRTGPAAGAGRPVSTALPA